jgi:hypothetical protein
LSIRRRKYCTNNGAGRILTSECALSTCSTYSRSTNRCAYRERSATDSQKISHPTGVPKRCSTPVRWCVSQPILCSEQNPRLVAAAVQPDHL